MNDSLGDRMKKYELASRTILPGRMPIIIRVDGKAFHTYTAQCARPFDVNLGECMIRAAKALCKDIQGAQLAYTQSDEISILVHCYKKFNSEAWFDNQVQKICSVSAGIASAHFTNSSHLIWGNIAKPAVFDARVFVLPESDVCNYFLWRQQDCMRNSIQMLARSLYSHKECDHKNSIQLQDMCVAKGISFNDIDIRWKRGICIKKVMYNINQIVWEEDFGIPSFLEDRTYINKYLTVEEE
jgi:tRNA(His) 5'-end guanylyltransferase